jgi:phosphoribosylformylglycinamidine cyclo-ligase
LTVHVSYLDAFTRISKVAKVKAMAHITGGGIKDNLSRVLPGTCDAHIMKGTWPVLKVFEFLARGGEVDEAEMYQVFNMGVGMTLVVSAADEKNILSTLGSEMEIYSVGDIAAGSGSVVLS